MTSIGSEAFTFCSSLTSIAIPNSVTSIGNGAFYGCSALTSITIPNSVDKIANTAFMGCSGLTSITIPNSVTSIGHWAFSHCSGLTSLTIGNSVTSIGSHAFDHCSALTSITIPNSLENIEEYAFYFCSNLASITIGNSVTSIGSYAFSGCSNLSSIIVDEENSCYDSRDDCNAIIETKSNTLISGCRNTTIPNSATSIGRSAFASCSGPTSLTIPNSVTSIGYGAFLKCSGITSITIGNSVSSIGLQAFVGCSDLSSIMIEKGNSYYDSRDNCNAIIETKSNTLISGCKNTIIPNSVTSIGESAFDNCSGLTSITIPNSITSIEYRAFYDCSGLTSVTIPNSVTSIDGNAFRDCSNLTSITCEATIPPTCGSCCYDGVHKFIPVYVPANSIDAYKKANRWKEFTNIQAIIVELVSISFANESENLIVGKTKTLTATIMPENATNKTITWTSSNTDVATVSTQGIVTAKGAGTTVITATTDNGKTAKCTITVEQPVTAIALSDATTSLWVGKTKTLTATVTPTTSSNTAVNWSSSNKNVATVSSKGVITAKGKGTCTITCTAADGYGTKSTCEVTVKQQVTEIALSETTVSLWVGDTKTITATASPTTANNTNVTWSSSDKNVATVSSKGVITAKGEGSCSITCTAADGYGTTSICKVTVKLQPTSIEELQIANDKSTIYNLNGQRINRSNALKGLYIINGKKYAK